MAHTALTPGHLTRTAMQAQPRAVLIAVIAALFGGAAFWSDGGWMAQAFGLAGGTLLALVGAIYGTVWIFRHNNKRAQKTIAEFVEHDAAPCFVTDDEGEIWYVNAAAKERFRGNSMTLAGLLGDVFANPLAVLHRLRQRAEKSGAARQDIVTRRGNIRLSTHQLAGGEYLWRVEEIADRASPGAGDLSFLPMMTVGRNGTVLYMNDAVRHLVGERIKNIDRLFDQVPPRVGVVNEIWTSQGQMNCFIAERELPGARREMILMPAAEEATCEADKVARVVARGKALLEQACGWTDVEALPVPLLKVTYDGKVLLTNRLARNLLGQGKCEGVHLATLMEGLGRNLTDWLSEVAMERETHSSEFLRVSRDDREVFVQVMLKRAADPNDPSLFVVLNDATELKTLEAQFVQSQKMQAIGQLAGGVAHDFNNLLTAISGHCDLLLLSHDHGDPDYNDLVQINQNANRAGALISQLLAFSRKQTLQLEILDLRDTMSDLTHLLNRLVGEKVSLTLDHDPKLKTLRADKRQLEQVVMNLVVNARDAMTSGGEISIRTRNITYKKPEKRDRATVPAGDYVLIEIIDQGTGIPADKMQKIFEPFYTTKRTGEGTGLGLSTAYGIVKQSGGFIFADSVPGTGSTFSLLFPAAHPDVATTQAIEHKAQTSTSERVLEPQSASTQDSDSASSSEKLAAKSQDENNSCVILLVEDEAPVRAFASRALRMKGYTVLEADSAEDALRTLQDTDLEIDLFVTDVVMPGMDGPSWVRKALEERPDVRVVFVSGYAEDAFGEGKVEIPNSTFLPKPFSLTELTETIRCQLH